MDRSCWRRAPASGRSCANETFRFERTHRHRHCFGGTVPAGSRKGSGKRKLVPLAHMQRSLPGSAISELQGDTHEGGGAA